MVEEDKEKTLFISEYAYNVVPFGLCNSLATFQKVVTQTFKEYFNDFMQYFSMISVSMDRRKSM
jgi:hypothetical protein